MKTYAKDLTTMIGKSVLMDLCIDVIYADKDYNCLIGSDITGSIPLICEKSTHPKLNVTIKNLNIGDIIRIAGEVQESKNKTYKIEIKLKDLHTITKYIEVDEEIEPSKDMYTHLRKHHDVHYHM